ncbi:MAG TPA: WecB/TagA/CpsF family glycosyltransferase [Planctomycetota bacterium]|nr:WecB/TagA/CpsF family glycosyltransferase [Planctomycetota bacterium]
MTLCGVRLDAVREAECVSLILERLKAGRGGWVVTVNLDHLRRLVRDAEYARLCQGACLMVADGMPLVWASRLQGTPLPERVAGSNLISSLSAAAAREGRSVYLLGGAAGSAVAAASRLQQRYTGLKVVGTDCPPMGFEGSSDQMGAIEERLLRARPDIVYVGLGSPKQERLIGRLRGGLPGAWWLGVGISFSFLGGQVRRAPRWMQLAGLEWVHRLAQEPRRLATRYLVQGVPFALLLFARACAARGLARHVGPGSDGGCR